MSGPTRGRAAFAALLLWGAGTAFGQGTGRWLASAEGAKPYAAVMQGLTAAAEAVVAADVPERFFLERLKEGVSKRAPADRLLRTMQEEAARLVFLARELDGSGLRMTAVSRERALADGALALRSSVSREEFRTVVAAAVSAGESAERVSATVSMLAAVDPSRVADDEARLLLAAAVAGSSIKTDRIDSLAAVFARGRSFGLRADRIARIVAKELAAGGTLASIDAAVTRERKNR